MEQNKIPVSYKKLWVLIAERGIDRAELGKMAGIPSYTMTKVKRNEYVSLDTLVKICVALNCTLDSIIEIGGIESNEQ